MNNSTIKWLNRSFLVISIITVLVTSCKKDEDDPEYVGSWAATQTIFTEDDLLLELRDIMTFTSDSYTEVVQILDESTNQYLDYLKLIGTLTAEETIMHVDITEIGLSTVDLLTGKPTGTIVMYKEGTSQFDNIFSQTGQSQTFAFEYSISENTMTIYSDFNSDNDYLDEGEAMVFTKQ